MSSQTKTILKYLATLMVGVALLWYFLSQQNPADIDKAKHAFRTADYYWIALTIIISLGEKVIRAHRWNILMEPLGTKPPLKNTFIAVMVVYFANIFAPRLGEVARCGILNRTDNIPVTTSFGTVVTERIIDFLSLLVLIGACLVLEYEKIIGLLTTTWNDKVNSMGSMVGKWYLIIGIIAIFFIGLLAFAYSRREKLKKIKLVIKIRDFITGLWVGIISIRKIDRKTEFFALTAAIWVCYLLMTYFAFFALPYTSDLGFTAGLVILVVGGLGMSAPVQAGLGAFHFFVKETLHKGYGVDEGGALSYAFLVHTSQTLMALVVGFVCFIISVNLSKKAKANLTVENANL